METIADRRLHIECSLTAIAACSNRPCKKSIVFGMHETAKRLLDLGRSRGAKDFTEIAKSLGGSVEFWSMVVLMVKAAFAVLPALFIIIGICLFFINAFTGFGKYR